MIRFKIFIYSINNTALYNTLNDCVLTDTLIDIENELVDANKLQEFMIEEREWCDVEKLITFANYTGNILCIVSAQNLKRHSDIDVLWQQNDGLSMFKTRDFMASDLYGQTFLVCKANKYSLLKIVVPTQIELEDEDPNFFMEQDDEKMDSI